MFETLVSGFFAGMGIVTLIAIVVFVVALAMKLRSSNARIKF